MKTLCLYLLPLALVSFARAETFDLTDSTVVGLITINGSNVTSFSTSSLQTIGDDYPTSIDTGFNIPSFSATFDIIDDNSSYLFSDRQGSFSLVNTSMETSFIIQAGSNIVLDFDFVSASAQMITGFEFATPSSHPELVEILSVQFNASTSELTLTFTDDFTVLDMENLLIDGRFLSTVPEPASSAALIGFGVLAGAMLRRRRRAIS